MQRRQKLIASHEVAQAGSPDRQVGVEHQDQTNRPEGPTHWFDEVLSALRASVGLDSAFPDLTVGAIACRRCAALAKAGPSLNGATTLLRSVLVSAAADKLEKLSFGFDGHSELSCAVEIAARLFSGDD